VRFRVSGKEAELWHPDTGAIEQADFSIADGLTTVPLNVSPRESVFVVFRRTTTSLSRTQPRAKTTTLATVTGPWGINFPANFGAPPTIQLEQLQSWTENANEGVKYFSGTAIYSRTIQAPRAWFRSGAQIQLDLGTVADLAEVSINGQGLGILWKQPYVVDATKVLKPGNNQLEIKVTNEWTNRIIGDRAGPPEKRVLSDVPARGTFGPPPTVAPSGLLGPVRILGR